MMAREGRFAVTRDGAPKGAAKRLLTSLLVF